MNTIRQFAGASRDLVHVLGLNKISVLQKGVDVLKHWLRTHTFPWPYRIQGSLMKDLSMMYYLTGVYEPDTTNYFRAHLKPGMTALDVGADFGYYSLLFSRFVGESGRVFAFEPFLERYANALIPNLALNKVRNVVAIPYGLDEKVDTHDYYADTHGFYTTGAEAPTERVQTIVFDDFLSAFGGPVHFVKIDTEGSELRILKGMKKTIAANPGIKIAIEIAPTVLARSGSSTRALLDLLERFDLNFSWINEDGTTERVSRQELEARLARIKYTNILCSHENRP